MHGDDDQGSNRDGSYCNYAQDGRGHSGRRGTAEPPAPPLIPDRETRRGERCVVVVVVGLCPRPRRERSALHSNYSGITAAEKSPSCRRALFPG